MSGAAAGTIILSAGPSFAQAIEPLDIAPQSLASALYEFGSKTDRQMMFSPEMMASKTTRGVSAAVDEKTALAQLLDGTGLTFRRQDDVYMIVQQGGSGGPQSGSAAGGGAEVEALIVTAQKREEDIQDVPIAISAFTQEDLTRSQVAGGPDLMTQVPNFTFTKTNFTGYSIQIRGIGTQAISATTDAAVAIAFNNTSFIRNRFFEQEFYDLERIEVLRGPQGTLYGRNATAGVVNIISAKPKFNFEAKLSGDIANFNSTRIEGMANIPLVEDAVALRLAGAWTKRDGYATNEITGNPIDGRDLWSTRVSLRFAPTNAFDVNLLWEHFEENDDRLRSGKQLCKKDVRTEIMGVPVPYTGGLNGPGGVYSQGCLPSSLYSPDSFSTPNGYSLPYFTPIRDLGAPTTENLDPYLSTVQSRDLRVIESTIDPDYRARSDLAQMQVEIDVGGDLSLTSETAYSTDFTWSLQDYNRFNTAPGAFDETEEARGRMVTGILNDGVFCDPQLGCTDRLVAVDVATAKSRQFSQELRLSSDYEGPFNFSLGANFLRYDTEDKYYVFVNTLTLLAGYPALSGGAGIPPWEPGVSDNSGCLLRSGKVEGDPRRLNQVYGCIYIDPNPIGSLNDEGHNYFLSRNPYKLLSYAVFGEAYYNLTDELKVTAGLRWTVDKKEAPQIPSWLVAARYVGYPVAEVSEQEWREPTGRLAIDWKPDLSLTDETLVYASYAHGYKAGGANPPPAVIAVYQGDGGGNLLNRSLGRAKTFEPEFVDAFEVGAKNTLLDGRLTLNATAFYYDYEGYQISQIIDRSANNLNFDTEVWGAEIEIDWRPLENLRLGFKGGYEKTRVADGEKAIDLMDRANGGLPDENGVSWIVARPFPTIPSNCVVPAWMVTYGGEVLVPPNISSANAGPCLTAYYIGHDPLTDLPYVPNPTIRRWPPGTAPLPAAWAGYPGFDPTTAPNGGAGFSKDLSGNELPNAPHFTATITADYTVPLPSDWLMTLHTDLYYQSEAWTRIFNMEGYDKLKAYTNVNLAAVFSNEDAGWKVMAYVKNVMDRDSITGAFLNSDDTGLTTNVFLTEPRLYGIRVTKAWTGGPLLGSFGERRDGPYPFTVEFGGQVQRHEAANAMLLPSFASAFPDPINTMDAQDQDLDWGDGRDVRLTYAPAGGPWSVSLGARFGKTNHGAKLRRQTEEVLCGVSLPVYCDPSSPDYNPVVTFREFNYSTTRAFQREEHQIVDFSVGREVGFGAFGGSKSVLAAGVRHAVLESASSMSTEGIPDRDFPPALAVTPVTRVPLHQYDGAFTAERRFEGVGPVISWEAGARLLDGGDVGRVDLEWALSGGVLFGRQETAIEGDETVRYFNEKYLTGPLFPTPVYTTPSSVAYSRSDSVTVPVAGASVGLSYNIDRMKIGAGYRWERYFDAIDGGYDEVRDQDRTIDGPYFKLSVGFGG